MILLSDILHLDGNLQTIIVMDRDFITGFCVPQSRDHIDPRRSRSWYRTVGPQGK